MGRSMRVCLYFVIILTPALGNGGWFGPDNYEECVLEKMESQNRDMKRVVEKACEKKFPYEKKLINYDENIDVSFNGEQGLIYILVRNNGNYELTRFRGNFSLKSCRESKRDSDFTLALTIPVGQLKEDDYQNIQSGVRSTGDSKIYKCMHDIYTIWGRLKDE